jgi:hypothetical protein
MAGIHDFWEENLKAFFRRRNRKRIRVKSDEVVVTSLNQKTPMSQSFLLCTILLALTIPVFFLEFVHSEVSIIVEMQSITNEH